MSHEPHLRITWAWMRRMWPPEWTSPFPPEARMFQLGCFSYQISEATWSTWDDATSASSHSRPYNWRGKTLLASIFCEYTAFSEYGSIIASFLWCVVSIWQAFRCSRYEGHVFGIDLVKSRALDQCNSAFAKLLQLATHHCEKMSVKGTHAKSTLKERIEGENVFLAAGINVVIKLRHKNEGEFYSWPLVVHDWFVTRTCEMVIIYQHFTTRPVPKPTAVQQAISGSQTFP